MNALAVRRWHEELVRVEIDPRRRAISDALACPLDRVMRRAPRAKPEAVGVEARVNSGVGTCDRAWQINRSAAAGTPSVRWPPEGLGIVTS